MSDCDFSTATAVLEAIIQPEKHGNLQRWLVVHDVVDDRFVAEAWRALWERGDKSTASSLEMAYAARLAVVAELAVVPSTTTFDIEREIPALVLGFSLRTSFATFGDEYIAASLKSKLPKVETVCQPRKLPAYAIAANVFGEGTNAIVRPLIQQPIKEVIRNTKWNEANIFSLYAVVITFKEMVRFPELYIDSDIAAADPHVPAIVVWGEPAQIGVLRNGAITSATSIVNAMATCLMAAQTSHAGAAAIIEVLQHKDTTSALYHAYTAGRDL